MKRFLLYDRIRQVRGAPPGVVGRRLRLVCVVLMLSAVYAMPRTAHAIDSENCLMCHRFRGLARIDREGDYRLFYVDEHLFNRGPHARVSCKGCHADIDKIPHDNAKPVDCLQECHIEEPTREIHFTHAKVTDALSDSVHAPPEANSAAQDLADDYPKCKDCHDMPLFRPVAMFKSVRSGVSDRAISRCLMCHKDESFIRYYYSHVTTRLHKARDPREVVEMCATCHGDTALAKRHSLPDVVSSYLETFHGKAVLFGSALMPDCLDCHAGHQSVHEMHAASDERSSMHPDNRAAVCGSEDCHAGATPAFASFDVHATRNMATHPMVFSVAVFFVLMTLAILLPILTLNILGYIRELFPSHEAEEEAERLTRIAEEKVASEGAIQRFPGLMRLQHAGLVILFVVLCLTGLPLKFAESSWAPTILSLFGGIEGAPIVHRVAGVALLLGFVLHAVLVLVSVRRSMKEKGKRGLWSFVKEIIALPMFPKKKDLSDIIAQVKYVFFLSPHRPNYGRFSWKEKLEYIGLIWGTILLGVTGILLWGESLSSHVIPGWVLNIAYIAHTYESILAVSHIVLVHIPGVIGRPGVSALSSMVTNGTISPRTLAEEHGDEIVQWGLAEEVKS